MKPYSSDLRRRIIEAIQDNLETQEKIAEQFSVSVAFVEKLWKRFRETGCDFTHRLSLSGSNPCLQCGSKNGGFLFLIILLNSKLEASSVVEFIMEASSVVD